MNKKYGRGTCFHLVIISNCFHLLMFYLFICVNLFIVYKCIKVKLSLCLTNWAPCHEVLSRRWCIDPRFLDIGSSWRWAVSFMAPPPVPIGYEPGWAPEQVWMLWRIEKFLILPGLEFRPLRHPARSKLLHWVCYPSSFIDLLIR
jgi:hypothetical protein